MSDAAPTPEAPQPQAPAAGEPAGTEKEDYLRLMPQEIQDYVNEIKAKGVSVFMTFLGESGYLFRTMNVMEWMKLQEEQKQRGQAQGATEEFLTQALYESIVLRTSLGVITQDDLGIEQLLPSISRDNIKGQPAGVPTSLAQAVMFHSGFDSNPVTVKL